MCLLSVCVSIMILVSIYIDFSGRNLETIGELIKKARARVHSLSNKSHLCMHSNVGVLSINMYASSLSRKLNGMKARINSKCRANNPPYGLHKTRVRFLLI